MDVFLNYDLRAPEFGPPPEDIYAACLDQCEWADSRGFAGVRLREHHGSEDGYLPSPIVLGAAAGARTERMRIRFSLIVLPLHDPVRVAEDLAVVDIATRGRVELVVGAGYVEREFRMFGRAVGERVGLLERGVAALRSAWAGREFELDGRPVVVRPVPYQGRAIPIILGGSSVRAARQAARIADGFEPAPQSFLAAYLEACAALGQRPGWYPGPGHGLRMLHVADRPDRAWARFRRHAAHENDSYARWTAEAGTDVGYRSVADPDELRSSGAYRIVTPGECIELLRKLGKDGEVHLHPLMGGMDPELGWESLTLFHSQVMPALASEGLL